MDPATTSTFVLPERLAAKADPALIAADEQHFARIADTLEQTVAELADRLESLRRAPGGHGEQALERDLEIHRLSARLRTLRRFSLDLCLGRIVETDAAGPVYIGRLGLVDREGRRLLVDWRAPAAEPFFAATHADPRGLASRRRYRWTRGRIADYWDEAFTPAASAGPAGGLALDDDSAFIASLASSRSPRMRDVLATIQSDQDAIIRAGSRGALVVDGGPGTGKTVVALHRAAYLLYADPRLGHRRGGLLFVGPSRPYLAYVADVLPSLGEEGVQTCTVRDLVPEGATALREADPEVARLKSGGRLLDAVEAAVRRYERPPAEELLIETPWVDVHVGADEWAVAFESVASAAPHDEAREEVWDELLTILVERAVDEDPDLPEAALRAWLAQADELRETFARAWPMHDPVGVVADLWSSPEHLHRCAPWLAPHEVRALQRDDPRAWTAEDLPFLDAARRRVGDPEASRRRRAADAAARARRERMADVVDDLIAADDSDLKLMSMLRVEDAQESLRDDSVLPAADPDLLAGPFAHLVVDESQELTDAEWRMLLARCPSRSLTIVGDRAQARHGFTESWEERLARIGLDRVELAGLTINYRTPEEVMAEAEPVIRAAIPDANVPTSIRSAGVPVFRGPVGERDAILDAWLADHAEGTACVIGDPAFAPSPEPGSRVRSLTPGLAKGLEFDLVVLVDPDRFGDGIEGAVDRYVAMTRATQRLAILTSG
ncbi:MULTISPECIES: RNA polymerase recycling motor ATPase HelR [unclassified Agromyces]|uniref:RNA polymerase recycling motor ATPase HelR n=1 Tax=unclassified Agromyces TaxID=2639701 RepID=UPI003014D403